ncbi:WYL domain-containing protein, partial [Salmonella enterica]|uniref:WYL domain-containing protein n=1 Tax=Salmonella enterica TaxID=28901 RepID=UPI000798971C
KRAYCLKTQPATGETYPKSDLFNKAKHDNGITLSCKAAHKNQIVPLILYWLPNVEIIEPVWLKEAVLTMLGKYLTAENVS